MPIWAALKEGFKHIVFLVIYNYLLTKKKEKRFTHIVEKQDHSTLCYGTNFTDRDISSLLILNC